MELGPWRYQYQTSVPAADVLVKSSSVHLHIHSVLRSSRVNEDEFLENQCPLAALFCYKGLFFLYSSTEILLILQITELSRGGCKP